MFFPLYTQKFKPYLLITKGKEKVYLIPSLRKGESLSIYLHEQTEKNIFLSDLQKGQQYRNSFCMCVCVFGFSLFCFVVIGLHCHCVFGESPEYFYSYQE